MRFIFEAKKTVILFSFLLAAHLMSADVFVRLPFKTCYMNESQIAWGKEKKGIKAGLVVMALTNQPDKMQDGVWCVPYLLFQTNSETKFYIGMTNTSTNCFAGIDEMRFWTKGVDGLQPGWTPLRARTGRLLPIMRNFEMSLTNASGNEVSRNAQGEKLRQTFSDNPVFEHGESGLDILNCGEVVQLYGQPSFRLNDFFDINQSGKYHLQVRARIFLGYARGKPEEIWKPLFLPPVDLDFTIPESR